MASHSISCALSETEYNFIEEYCLLNRQSLYSFVKEAVRQHITRTSETRDMRQALDNLVEDPNCAFRLLARSEQGVIIENKRTGVTSDFPGDSEAADYILDGEGQATMQPLYSGGRLRASLGASLWFKKMGAGWDPDKLDGVAMVAEQIAAKREGKPEFADLPVIILTRDVIKAFEERITIDEQG